MTLWLCGYSDVIIEACAGEVVGIGVLAEENKKLSLLKLSILGEVNRVYP
jgi:hypothetical protein